MDFFTVNYRGTLYRLPGLPMDRKCIIHYVCRLTEVFIRHITNHCSTPPGAPPHVYEPAAHATKTFRRFCATRDEEAPDYSRTWTTSYFSLT
jgi:hypothetical protein